MGAQAMSLTDARAALTVTRPALSADGALEASLAPSSIPDTPATTSSSAADTVAADPTPSQTAQKLIEWGAAKSLLSTDRLIVLGVLAGAFIALGGAFF